MGGKIVSLLCLTVLHLVSVTWQWNLLLTGTLVGRPFPWLSPREQPSPAVQQSGVGLEAQAVVLGPAALLRHSRASLVKSTAQTSDLSFLVCKMGV